MRMQHFNLFKTIILYLVLFFIAYMISDPTIHYLHEYEHIQQAQRNNWTYSVIILIVCQAIQSQKVLI